MLVFGSKRGYGSALRFEMQDLLRDAPVLGVSVEHRKVSSKTPDKKKLLRRRFAFRNYKAERFHDSGVSTTWELPGFTPGLYTLSIKAFNCAGWGEIYDGNVSFKPTTNEQDNSPSNSIKEKENKDTGKEGTLAMEASFKCINNLRTSGV